MGRRASDAQGAKHRPCGLGGQFVWSRGCVARGGGGAWRLCAPDARVAASAQARPVAGAQRGVAEAEETALERGDIDGAVAAVVEAWLQPDAPTGLRERVAAMQRRAFALQRLVSDVQEGHDPLEDDSEVLGRLQIPVLAAAGEADMPDFKAGAAEIAELVPRGEVAVNSQSDVPAFPRLRARSGRRRGTNRRPRFHALGGVSATSGRALLLANLGSAALPTATENAAGAHRADRDARNVAIGIVGDATAARQKQSSATAIDDECSWATAQARPPASGGDPRREAGVRPVEHPGVEARVRRSSETCSSPRAGRTRRRAESGDCIGRVGLPAPARGSPQAPRIVIRGDRDVAEGAARPGASQSGAQSSETCALFAHEVVGVVGMRRATRKRVRFRVAVRPRQLCRVHPQLGRKESAGAAPACDGGRSASPEAFDLLEAGVAQRVQLGVEREVAVLL